MDRIEDIALHPENKGLRAAQFGKVPSAKHFDELADVAKAMHDVLVFILSYSDGEKFMAIELQGEP